MSGKIIGLYAICGKDIAWGLIVKPNSNSPAPN